VKQLNDSVQWAGYVAVWGAVDEAVEGAVKEVR
jgi:hypothetical protein